MALKSIIDKLEDIDEAFREHYKERDGHFYLDIEEFGKHPGAVTLKTTLDKVNKDKKDLSAEVSAMKTKFGDLVEDEEFTLDGYNTLKASAKDPSEAINTLNTQHANAVSALKTKYEKEVSDREERITSLNDYIDNALIDNGLKDSLLDVGVNPDLLEGAVAALRSKVKVVQDEKSNRTAVITTDIGDQPIPEFVKSWVGDKGKAYLGKAAGPAPEGQQRGRKGTPRGNFGGSHTERADAIRSKFPELE